MEQIINSILDTDLYKLSMMMAVAKKFPYAKVRYKFINRGGTQFPEGFAEELRKQVQLMENLRLTKDEKRWLSEKIYFFDPVYLDILYGYQYNSTEVGIIQNGGDLQVTIEGYWHRTILWEVPLMAIISELYFKMTEKVLATTTHVKPRSERYANNIEKAKFFALHGMKVAEFGSRRRYSAEIQEEVIKDFLEVTFNKFLVGTSNVHLAHKYNLTAIGTQAHEWFMFHGAKYGYKIANRMAMEHWVDVYRGDLGIALSDTFTTDSFLQCFDKKFAKLYDGVRQDSGDPILFTDKVVAHYNSLGIDPMYKTIVFSDNLDKDTAYALDKYCSGMINCSFGIGTNLSNDVGIKPLNMVIKMSEAKPEGEGWRNVIKLSDSEGKHTGDQKEIEVCKYILGI